MTGLQELLTRIEMPQAGTDRVLETAARIPQAEIEAAADAFFGGSAIRTEIDAMARQAGVPFETATLCVLLQLSDRTRAAYRAAGWPEDVFYATMTDFTVWAKTCVRAMGDWGIPRANDWWLHKHLRRELVRLGRMQFEPSEFMLDTYHGWTVDLHRGDPVLNCHIPEGGSFSKALRLDAYARAVDFFGQNLFAVESWFLYPAHREILRPESNIIGFMDEFTTLHTEVWHDGRDLWRIFGFLDSYAPENLPRETSMQRAYAAHLEKTGETGGGYGIMLFENGRCVQP